MDNNKIDKLFQEQLKNIEFAPNKNVWSNIETKLKKKKRRIIPFWLFSSAAASLIFVTLLLFRFSGDKNLIEKNNTDNIITVAPKKKTNINNQIDAKTDPKILDKNLPKETLITQKNNPIIKQENFINIKSKKVFKITKEPVKIIALSASKINIDFISSLQGQKITLIEKLNNKLVSQKMDINKLVASKEPIEVNKKPKESWSVAPLFAVLQSNSFSDSSPINPNLANSTKGESSFSYGLQVSYKINKKWTIQSGVHLQEMSYSNNKIAVYQSSIINTTATEFTNGDYFSFNSNSNENLDLNINSFASNSKSNGNLTQNYGYIEIPLEVKYNFSNSEKLKTQLVTGFSSLFLNKNTIILNTENLFSEGKASNLNNINFSANLGVDFNYLINKNWSLNLNPMLKVQLNTFNENGSNFSPFFVGMYSGITYEF